MNGRKRIIGNGKKRLNPSKMNLSDMRRYIVQTQGKVVSMDQLRSFINRLPKTK